MNNPIMIDPAKAEILEALADLPDAFRRQIDGFRLGRIADAVARVKSRKAGLCALRYLVKAHPMKALGDGIADALREIAVMTGDAPAESSIGSGMSRADIKQMIADRDTAEAGADMETDFARVMAATRPADPEEGDQDPTDEPEPEPEPEEGSAQSAQSAQEAFANVMTAAQKAK